MDKSKATGRTKLVLVLRCGHNPLSLLLYHIISMLGATDTGYNLNAFVRGYFGYHKLWSDFVDASKIPVQIISYREFASQYPPAAAKYDLPTIFLLDRGIYVPVATSKDLEELSSLRELIDYLDKRLHKQSGH